MNNQSDNLDVAAEYTQERTDATVAAQVAEYRQACARISRDDCAECGDEIPEGRRVAVPGVQHCVICAEHLGVKKNGVRRV